jgi:hypothetical protein
MPLHDAEFTEQMLWIIRHHPESRALALMAPAIRAGFLSALAYIARLQPAWTMPWPGCRSRPNSCSMLPFSFGGVAQCMR